MNKHLLLKFGPIAGLAVSLFTTGVAGYRIFAAPLTHAEEIPALPTPTTAVAEENNTAVETVYDDVYVTPTPKPTQPTLPTGTVGVRAAGTVSVTDPSVVIPKGESESRFEDGEDDRVEFSKKEDHESNESPEPTERPEPTEAPEH